MTDGEIFACIEALDKRKPRGGDRRSEKAKSKASDDAIEKPGKSAAETANLLGISTTKVERNRSVLKNGDPETIEAVKNGEISANEAYQKTRKNRKKTRTESEPTNAAKKAIDEVQELEKAEESEKYPDYGPVFLSVEHFGALRELGGCTDEHVANAIEAYLLSFKNQCEQTTTGDDQEDDDEEYFDPADYEDEE